MEAIVKPSSAKGKGIEAHKIGLRRLKTPHTGGKKCALPLLTSLVLFYLWLRHFRARCMRKLHSQPCQPRNDSDRKNRLREWGSHGRTYPSGCSSGRCRPTGAAQVGVFVYRGDVVQTAANGAVGISFTDGTAFNISSNAPMVLNEFVYDPKGKQNSTLISLSKGTFTFVAGQVAKTGDMKIDTPVATMGIRGTTPHVEISDDGTVAFSTLIEDHRPAGPQRRASNDKNGAKQRQARGVPGRSVPAGSRQAAQRQAQHLSGLFEPRRASSARIHPPPAEAGGQSIGSTVMKFRPLHDRVVVERIDAEAKSAGGIIIPDSAQEKPSQGKIVAVGLGGVGAVLIRTPDGKSAYSPLA